MRKFICLSAGSLGFVAAFLLLISGPLARLDILHFSTSFQLMRWAAYLGIATIVLVVLAFVLVHPTASRHRLVLGASLLAGIMAFYLPFSQLQQARSVPPIHDITTDLDNPPEFVAIAPIRESAPNPVEYPGEEVAEQQREAYPDIQPLTVERTLTDVHDLVIQTVQALGWELVAAEFPESAMSQVEATDTTFWYGFKDDVVIRSTAIDEHNTRIDVRSKSRVGGSDVGANAARIRSFMERLQSKL